MSVAGVCEICREPDVEFTCDRCGKLVCEDHFDASVGYCVECVAELSGGDRGGDATDPGDLPDGAGTYRS